MAQRRSLIILGFALLLGLAAVYITNSYLNRIQKKEEQVQQGMVKVAVARVPLDFGAAISEDKIRMVDWPRDSLPQGTFQSPMQLTTMGKNRVVIRPMQANEPILSSKLSGEGGRATISAVLHPDMRAAAVRVSDVAAVGGFVLPGDTVDVLVTRADKDQYSGNSGNEITDVLLQNVRVLAIDQNANDTKNDPQVGKTATLEVNQIDAQKLALAQQVGSLTLVLRNVSDQANPAVQTVSTDDLRDGAYVGALRSPRPALVAASFGPPPPRFRPARQRPKGATVLTATATVEVVRGLSGTSYEVKRYGAH